MAITLPKVTFLGDVIDERLFGGNLVFTQDSVTGTFPARADAAGLEVIRFPGGGVTELLFDPANPNAESDSYVNESGETVELSLVPLDDFLDYARTEDLGAIIVVPVQRYLDAWKDEGSVRDTILTEADKTAIHAYVTTALESGVRIHAIEIGNAPSSSGVNDADYAKIVNEMVVAVHDAAEEFQTAGNLPDGYVHPLLSVETTPYNVTADTNGDGFYTYKEALEQRFEQFTPEALERIDAVTMHRYVSGDYDKIDGFQAPWTLAEKADELVGRDLELLVTEWNISANQNGVFNWDDATDEQRDSVDTGLKHAGAVAALFHELAVNNVEMAAFWAVQQKNDVSLAGREGTNTDLRPGGKMFDYLSENTQGLRAIGSIPKKALDRAIREEDFDLHAFGSDERQFLVINSRHDEAQQVELDLTTFSGTVEGGWVEIMTAAEGQDPRDPDVDTVIEHVPFEEAFKDGALSLSLDPWEVALVSLDLAPTAEGEGTGQPGDEDDANVVDEDEDEAEGGGGGGCFVATCAYGDADHPDVAYLRHYRDVVLAETSPGRGFIRLYYSLGPYLARWMAPYPKLRQLARAGLSRLVRHLRARHR